MSHSDFNPRVVALDEETGDEIVSVLSSDTTRRVYSVIEDQPSTPKTIADSLDMSIQNVHYHLDKIHDAGLVESAGIEYSEKGREMQVYEASHEDLIICDDKESKEHLDRLLKRLIDGSMVAAILALLTHFVLARLLGIGPGTERYTPEAVPSGSPHSETTVPFWELPAVWVLLIALLATIIYVVWMYQREKPGPIRSSSQ